MATIYLCKRRFIWKNMPRELHHRVICCVLLYSRTKFCQLMTKDCRKDTLGLIRLCVVRSPSECIWISQAKMMSGRDVINSQILQVGAW